MLLLTRTWFVGIAIIASWFGPVEAVKCFQCSISNTYPASSLPPCSIESQSTVLVTCNDTDTCQQDIFFNPETGEIVGHTLGCGKPGECTNNNSDGVERNIENASNLRRTLKRTCYYGDYSNCNSEMCTTLARSSTTTTDGPRIFETSGPILISDYATTHIYTSTEGESTSEYTTEFDITTFIPTTVSDSEETSPVADTTVDSAPGLTTGTATDSVINDSTSSLGNEYAQSTLITSDSTPLGTYPATNEAIFDFITRVDDNSGTTTNADLQQRTRSVRTTAVPMNVVQRALAATVSSGTETATDGRSEHVHKTPTSSVAEKPLSYQTIRNTNAASADDAHIVFTTNASTTLKMTTSSKSERIYKTPTGSTSAKPLGYQTGRATNAASAGAAWIVSATNASTTMKMTTGGKSERVYETPTDTATAKSRSNQTIGITIAVGAKQTVLAANASTTGKMEPIDSQTGEPKATPSTILTTTARETSTTSGSSLSAPSAALLSCGAAIASILLITLHVAG